LGLVVLWMRMEEGRGVSKLSLGGEGVHRLFLRCEEKVKPHGHSPGYLHLRYNPPTLKLWWILARIHPLIETKAFCEGA
jgi:hypothetical protein